mgnify:CR=1 FL=1
MNITRDVLLETNTTSSTLPTGMNYPVAVKIVSRDIAHKTDIGGVKLNTSRINPGRPGGLVQEITVPPGRSVIEFRTPQPLTVPGRGDDRRLGAMIHGIEVEVLP